MTITDLIAHIRAGTVESIMFHDVIWHSAEDAIVANNGSVDAAIRLCRDLLPGCIWSVHSDGNVWLSLSKSWGSHIFDETHHTTSISFLIAVLTAWRDQHGET
jgi:hypothetical protein